MCHGQHRYIPSRLSPPDLLVESTTDHRYAVFTVRSKESGAARECVDQMLQKAALKAGL